MTVTLNDAAANLSKISEAGARLALGDLSIEQKAKAHPVLRKIVELRARGDIVVADLRRDGRAFYSAKASGFTKFYKFAEGVNPDALLTDGKDSQADQAQLDAWDKLYGKGGATTIRKKEPTRQEVLAAWDKIYGKKE